MADSVNFRATSGYVTDAATDTYDLGAAYPVTRGGLTFGWATSNAANMRDRGNLTQPRVSGMGFVSNGGATKDWKIDLPSGAGTYDVRLALGDGAGPSSPKCLIMDGATTLATVSTVGQGANFFQDAAGTANQSPNTWYASNATVQLTFAGSQMTLRLGDAGGSGLTAIAHVGVAAATPSIVLSGSITLDDLVASGALSSIASSLAGTITLDDIVASGSLGAAPGVLTTTPVKNWSGTILGSATIPKVAVLRVSDMAAVLTLTNQVTSAGGILTISNVALVAGTQYLLVTCSADGSAFGAQTFVAT